MKQPELPPLASGVNLTLISHHLCPYVQRAVIALTEKGVPFERIYIDLADKPDWFEALSPLGKTPVLLVGGEAIFESAVILEYLEDTQPSPMHPGDPLARARHRALIEYASVVLSDIWAFYTASDAGSFEAGRLRLRKRFAWLDGQTAAAPWFAGREFSLVDAAFGPVFRYFDVFDRIADFGILSDQPNLARWRGALAARPSVRGAVPAGYEQRLWDFLKARDSHLSGLMDVALSPTPPDARTVQSNDGTRRPVVPA